MGAETGSQESKRSVKAEIRKKAVGDFPADPVVKTTLPLQEAWVQFWSGN